MSQVQTKSVEYYRAAPAAPGMSYSIDLERVNPPTRPTRSPSDPPPVAPLVLSKRAKSPPAAISVPLVRTDLVRPARSPARQSVFDEVGSTNSREGPPGPPPQGPLPPLPDQSPAFADPMLLRAVSAKERRRQSRVEDSDLASLDRSMRRLSRISITHESGPVSPTISHDSHLAAPSQRAEKLLRRLSRQSDGVRLPADYSRVGISGFSVPTSAPVSPGLRGIPPPLHEQSDETELAYLRPALSVPMRRNVEHSHSAPGAFVPNSLGLGLGISPSDSMSSTMASTSMSSLASVSSMSTLPSDTLSTLPSDATIKPPKPEYTRTTRIDSLSSSASSAPLLTPVSPPTDASLLPRSPGPKPLRLKPSSNLRLPAPPPRSPLPPTPRSGSPDIPDLLSQYRDSLVLPPREAAYRESTVLPDSGIPRGANLLSPGVVNSRCPSPVVSETCAVLPSRMRPGARPRVHSDLAPADLPPAVPPKDTEYELRESSHSAVEDSGNVLVVAPRESLESQATPRPKATDRPASPDIAYILRTTPRPTRRTSVASLASSTVSARRPSSVLPSNAPPSAFRPMPGMGVGGPSRQSSISSSRRSSGVTASSAGFDVDGLGPEVFYGEQYDSEDSDSDLDLATPLPHMMLRAGLLSPRSTIITESSESPMPRSASGLSARGEALRAKGEKVWRAETRRKIRHRDGQNLRDGVGLTTGLGWSDSEDEDAPSPLRRRLSSVLLARAHSRPPSQLSRQSYSNLSRRSTFSNLDSPSVSSSSHSNPRTPAIHPLTLPHIPPPLPLSLPLTPSSLPGATGGPDEFGKLDFPMPPTATSWRGQPSPNLRTVPSNGLLRSTSSSTAGGGASTSLLRARTVSSTSSAATTSGSSQAQSPRLPLSPRQSLSPRASLASRPAPRSIKVSVRPAPSGTRLSAPEALRQTQAVDASRRLSGA